MLPRGTLREPLNHLNRADVCLLTKVDQASKSACKEIRDTLAKYNDQLTYRYDRIKKGKV